MFKLRLSGGCHHLAILVVLSMVCIFSATKSLHEVAISIAEMSEPATYEAWDNAKGARQSEFIELWNEYVSQHSEEALRNEFGLNGTFHGQSQRKFAIGYYSCPNQAGNRMHHFVNNLIWAIITNRTLLWKYYDRETCEVVGRGFDEQICLSANSESDCSKVLERAGFLPSYDYWSSRLGLPSPQFLPYWSTSVSLGHPIYWYKGVQKDIVPGIVDTTNATVVIFANMFHQNLNLLATEEAQNRLLNTTSAKERVKQLLSESIDLVYGSLFLSSFSFHPSISVSPRFPEKEANEGIAVVLHSRHVDTEDDGSGIQKETRCLHKVLNGTKGSCQVSLLSDRPKTLESVSQFLATTYPHCAVLVAPHDVGESFKSEHGPFAGVGFYQDLALVSNQTLFVPTTKTAFIGSGTRSSSKLVKEVMTYQLHRRIQRDGSSGEFLTCFI